MDVLVMVLGTAVVVVVVVPLVLGWLLVRGVRRSRWARHARHAAAGGAESLRLSRLWPRLVTEARTAAERYSAAVAALRRGPLRDSLTSAEHEVRAAVAEAQRLAARAERTQAAHSQVLAGLQRQRRRSTDGIDPALRASLAAAVRAQQDSARRLEAALQGDRCRLELLVARLHEIAAHACELSTLAEPATPLAATSVADRVAALRAATVELEQAAVA